MMELLLTRSVFNPAFTLGQLSIDGRFFGFTCEDTDRRLETDGTKVSKETAIPRGRYRVVLSFSNRFKKLMSEVLDVPGFSGIRIHGGNTAADTAGCPLLGRVRTAGGVADCAERNATLVKRLEQAADAGEEVWLEVV